MINLKLLLPLILVVSPSCEERKAPESKAPRIGAEVPGRRTDSARDSFLDTRPRPTKPISRPPPTTNQARTSNKPRANAGSEEVCLGLGCTIFRQNSDGKLVRASSEEVFHKDDRLRFVIEPNSDGYLYVFNSGNGQSAEMIFPNPRLNGGLNRVEGHVQYEVPSSQESNPNSRWFEVQGDPATEHVYFVVTRAPMDGVPSGKKLIAACGLKRNDCAWEPAKPIWESIIASLNGSSRTSQKRDSGSQQSMEERTSARHGIKLPADAAAPSVIKMNNSAQTKMLTLQVDITHK